MDLHDHGSKHMKSAKDVPLGVSSKNFYPHPHQPQIPKILHNESSFSCKTRINLGGSAIKIRT